MHDTLFSISDPYIDEDGMLTTTVKVDPDFVLDWFQTVPGINGSSIFDSVVIDSVYEALGSFDFGDEAKPGDCIQVIDIKIAEPVDIGRVVENLDDGIRIVTDGGVETFYSRDHFAFRYVVEITETNS